MSDVTVKPDVEDMRTWTNELRHMLRTRTGVAREISVTDAVIAPYGSRVLWRDVHARRLWEHVLNTWMSPI
jgi:hypothetical protein